MSSREANPSSYIRIADMRYGTSSALTIKPLRSFVWTAYLPRSAASASDAAITSSDVSRPWTISISDITGTGEKKCRPTTRSGRFVHDAISAIGIDDVFEARKTASGSSASSFWNSRPLTCGSSTTASTTASAARRSARFVVWTTRRSTASASSTLPRAAARSTDRRRLSAPRASGSGSGSYAITCLPARAADSAIPEPMKPAPTTATVEMSTMPDRPFSRRPNIRGSYQRAKA